MNDVDWKTHQLDHDNPVSVEELTTKGKKFCDSRADAEAEFHDLRLELIALQERLYAEGSQKLLIVFQAMDAGGKDGTIRNLLRGVNPQGVRVNSFKAPSSLELAHDYLWRIHKAVPAKGMIGVFNRSHYEDVLVVRVENLAPEAVWQERYEQINQFEKLLDSSGTRLLKFYLHISKKEQKKRFQSRLDEPNKHWKFSIDDLAKRKRWEQYMAAYDDVLNRCTSPWAPWYVIPANQKWYRNLAVARVVVGQLRQMNPQFPKPQDGLEAVIVE